MSRYIVLIPDDEAAWEASTEEDKQRMYALHARFSDLLEEPAPLVADRRLDSGHQPLAYGRTSMTLSPSARTVQTSSRPSGSSVSTR